jgi:hypothetical protein
VIPDKHVVSRAGTGDGERELIAVSVSAKNRSASKGM